MITEDQAKEIVHGLTLNGRDQLLVLLAIDPMQPLSIEQIKERCVRVGLRGLAKKNISDILGKSNGWVARTVTGWELQSAGKNRLVELAPTVLVGSQKQTSDSTRVEVKPLRETSLSQKRRVLIIHGHDERNLLALKDLLQSKLRFPEPIIMAQQTIPGASLPEKFERLAETVEFAVALLTPDDVGRALKETELKPRPRQNTVIEIGWFWGRLGRDRILLLVKEELELPSDLQGVEYHRFRSKVEEASEKIRDFFTAHRSLDSL